MEKSNFKIIFFGTSSFAVPAFKYLVQNGYNVVAVVTQPEKPTGRQRITMPSPVKKAAVELNIPILELHSLKDEESFKKFKHLNPDICIVAAYGKLIPSQYLEIPRYRFLNIHPSLLPKYRGPSPVQAAIINGDEETGVSIMLIDEQMDHGSILKNGKWKMENGKYYKELEKELAELGGNLLLQILPKYISGDIKLQEQDHGQATFTKMLSHHDGKIDWGNSAERIYNQVRALNPEPGTWTTWKGKVLNIKEAGIICQGSISKAPGTVVSLGGNIAVATKKCYLILKQIQLEGGKKNDAKSFINGHSDFINSKLD